LIGSKEGIAHLPLAFVNPKEVVLVPSPAYPVYHSAALFAGGTPFSMPLLKENNFLPDLSRIPADVAKAAKLMFLNYPNNPTSAVAERNFFKEVVDFAKRYQIIICHDAAYTELSFDGYRPISFLEVDGAKEVGIEFHSLSKTYNMTGWRIGFAVGNRDVIGGLGEIKTNIDSGIFQAVQFAGIEALEGNQGWIEEIKKIYTERRDALFSGLKRMGLEVEKPKATFYLWIATPEGKSSVEFASYLLNEAGVVTTPGVGLGEYGEGYIRMALTVNKEKIEQAVKRIEKVL
jgi:LL-diaminopimelate aminotransferase